MVDTSTDAVAKLLDGVRPGPWEFDPLYATIVAGSKSITEVFTSDADARFIAAARDLVPALLAERDALKSEVERLKAMPIFTPDDATRVPEIMTLIEAAKALHTDMLERAECRMDTIRGEQYRIVNSGRTAWANFDAALRAIAEGRE